MTAYRTSAAPAADVVEKTWHVAAFVGGGSGLYRSGCLTCGSIYKRSKVCEGRRSFFGWGARQLCPRKAHFHNTCDCGSRWLEATLRHPEGGDWL